MVQEEEVLVLVLMVRETYMDLLIDCIILH